MRRFFCSITLIATLTPVAAFAGNAGSVRGYIRDQNEPGTAVANAVVMLVGANARRSVETDADGFYVIWNLPPGRYALSATREGYQPLSRLVCVSADNDQYASLTLTRSLVDIGVGYPWYLYMTSLEPNASQTVDVYNLGACN